MDAFDVATLGDSMQLIKPLPSPSDGDQQGNSNSNPITKVRACVLSVCWCFCISAEHLLITVQYIVQVYIGLW